MTTRFRARPEGSPDVFQLAKAAYDVLAIWRLLGLSGQPTIGANLSPFREERKPSFSIHADGRKWKDHGTGEGGDIIDFIRVATGWSHSEIRGWLSERLAIGCPSVRLQRPPPATSSPQRTQKPPKRITWPAELTEGSKATWDDFARLRGLSYPAVWVMMQRDLLRFCQIDGKQCFVILDERNRAAEIRRLDSEAFGNGRKAYPLPGVDKPWLVGAALIPENKGADWAICEGATDYPHLVDLFVRYRRSGGRRRVVPMAMLGASVKHLAPEIMDAVRGISIILIPDADEAGDKMAEHWKPKFAQAGASVETVKVPRGKDLRDMCLAGKIKPEDIFGER